MKRPKSHTTLSDSENFSEIFSFLTEISINLLTKFTGVDPSFVNLKYKKPETSHFTYRPSCSAHNHQNYQKNDCPGFSWDS